MPPGREDKRDDFPPWGRPEMRRTWELLEHVRPEPRDVPETDEAWTDLQARLLEPPLRSIRRPDRSARRLGARIRTGIATGILLLAGVAVALWAWRQPVSVTAPPGELVTAHLPDGSTAQLNSGTTLRFQRHFETWPWMDAQERTVALEGEAYFEVESSGRPFVVATADARVEVLGTAFNVRSWENRDERGTEVALARGRVRVTAGGETSRRIVLSQPGEVVRTGSVADSTLEVRTASLDQVLAWRRRAFAAVDRPVAAILADVERQYALTVEIDEGLVLEDSMTLLYGPGTTPEHILHDICLVQGCRYRPTSRGFAVFADAPERAQP